MEFDKESSRFGSKRKYTGLLQFVIYMLFALGPLTGNVILVLFGTLSVEFGVLPTVVAIAIPSFMFPFAIVQLFSGVVSDIKGRIPVILFGLIIFATGITIAIFSTSLITYVIANILGGIGFGFVNPVLIALMTDISTGPNIPKKMGFLGAVANLGVGLGPILAGQLVIIGWRVLYVIFVLIIVAGFVILIALGKLSKPQLVSTPFKTFLKHITFELKRPVVLLLIFSAFLASQSYLAVITWTSQALTLSNIPKNIMGFIIGLAGIFGAIAGIIIGFLIKKKGVKIALMTGIITLISSLLIFLSIGDITATESLIFVSLGFVFTGIAGGTFIPAIMFYSQTLSRERRGALAGLATMGQFFGTALVPIIYDPFYHQGGIKWVYPIITLISLIFAVGLLMLYLAANKKE